MTMTENGSLAESPREAIVAAAQLLANECHLTLSDQQWIDRRPVSDEHQSTVGHELPDNFQNKKDYNYCKSRHWQKGDGKLKEVPKAKEKSCVNLFEIADGGSSCSWKSRTIALDVSHEFLDAAQDAYIKVITTEDGSGQLIRIFQTINRHGTEPVLIPTGSLVGRESEWCAMEPEAIIKLFEDMAVLVHCLRLGEAVPINEIKEKIKGVAAIREKLGLVIDSGTPA